MRNNDNGIIVGKNFIIFHREFNDIILKQVGEDKNIEGITYNEEASNDELLKLNVEKNIFVTATARVGLGKKISIKMNKTGIYFLRDDSHKNGGNILDHILEESPLYQEIINYDKVHHQLLFHLQYGRTEGQEKYNEKSKMFIKELHLTNAGNKEYSINGMTFAGLDSYHDIDKVCIHAPEEEDGNIGFQFINCGTDQKSLKIENLQTLLSKNGENTFKNQLNIINSQVHLNSHMSPCECNQIFLFSGETSKLKIMKPILYNKSNVEVKYSESNGNPNFSLGTRKNYLSDLSDKTGGTIVVLTGNGGTQYLKPTSIKEKEENLCLEKEENLKEEEDSCLEKENLKPESIKKRGGQIAGSILFITAIMFALK